MRRQKWAATTNSSAPGHLAALITLAGVLIFGIVEKMVDRMLTNEAQVRRKGK